MRTALLSIAYLPPLQYFSKFFLYNRVLIESTEHYTKQTYRNRCVILSANGPLALTIPVVKTNGNRTPIGEVLIDNTSRWQANHLRAFEAAYRSSPYFEFVYDLLYPFYTKRFERLIDYNLTLLAAIFDFLEITPGYALTDSFYHTYSPAHYSDFRHSIHPKHDFRSDREFVPVQYYQVFAHKTGFSPNLSIVDLLCNEGLFAVRKLKEMGRSNPVEG